MTSILQSEIVVDTQIASVDSLPLDCGILLVGVKVAYETYGTLNAARNNAILLLHAFTGDAHAAGVHKRTGQSGWWSAMVGPGLAFDTDQYFIICSNVLGGCQGTTGPGSKNPATDERYAMQFPVITIADMVRLQRELIYQLGIRRLLAVAGGSMGGMQALQWAVSYPDSVAAAIPIATTSRHSAQQIAFNEVARQAIISDPDWASGNYYDGALPGRGLAVARMVGHITYMSDGSMREKFGRRLQDKDALSFDFSVDFEVESYLRYRGSQFVTRFDANSYLYITKAMDYFDLSNGHASLGAAFDKTRARFLVISFTSDWLYPTYQSLETVSALRSRGIDIAYCQLDSSYGHDAFLLEIAEQSRIISGFLRSVAREALQKPFSTHALRPVVEDAIANRSDYATIAELVPEGSSVLDLGCGAGELLAWLRDQKGIKAQGVEIDPVLIQRAIASGVSAYQSDIEQGLTDYPDCTFDYVILSQTLQEMRYPLRVLREMLRVGKHAIVAFPNFGHWSTRFSHLVSGKAPRTNLFPYDWYESPNLHFLTIEDFVSLCRAQGWIIEHRTFVSGSSRVRLFPNLVAEVAVFSIRGADRVS